MLQKWLRDKLQGYIIDIANRVLPQRMHELEVQHCLYAKKVIVKILRKNILGLCYPGYKTIILSPRIIRKHSVNHVFSSPTSIINFTSKKPSYDDTRRSGRDNELLQRAQNDL